MLPRIREHRLQHDLSICILYMRHCDLRLVYILQTETSACPLECQECRVFHACRIKKVFLYICFERLPRNLLDNESQQIVCHVAVHRCTVSGLAKHRPVSHFIRKRIVLQCIRARQTRFPAKLTGILQS